MQQMRVGTSCLALLIFAAGCGSGDDRNISKDEAGKTESPRKVIINSPPEPPAGYERPTVDIEKLKEKLKKSKTTKKGNQ